MKKQKKKKKIKIRFDRIFLFLLLLSIFGFGVYGIFHIRISNILIKGNQYLTDQEIIELAGISNYPSTLQNGNRKLEKKLVNDTYIKSAKVSKKWFTKVTITVEENRPLFYYETDHKTILLDGTSVDKNYNVPTVLNYITDSYYDNFVKKMGELDPDILLRISEIRFMPNEVDDNRFFLSMSDGNYVYVNIATFDKLNKYLTIMESLPSQNGILYLDYGNNFEILK